MLLRNTLKTNNNQLGIPTPNRPEINVERTPTHNKPHTTAL